MKAIKKDYTISILRFMAMVFIIICHMMQYYNFFLCTWFNVGVQIFLCISGLLFGMHSMPSDLSLYIKRRFVRIYLSYVILIIPIIILFFIFHSDYISFPLAIKMLFSYDTISGGGHLWYIPTIMMCYFLSVFYWLLYEKIEDPKKLLLLTITVLLIQVLIFETFLSYFNSAWINCYFLGFFLGQLRIKGFRQLKVQIEKTIIIIALVSNVIQITIDYFWPNIPFDGILLGCYHRYCNYAHVCLGVAIVILVTHFFRKVDWSDVNHAIRDALDLSDRYSYEIYLIHQFLILGPFSLMSLTNVMFVNVVIIIIGTLLLSIVLKWISDYAARKLIS